MFYRHGEKITEWELNEYEKSKEIRKNSLIRSVEGINKKQNPYLLTNEINVIDNIKHMGGIDKKVGDSFLKLKNRVIKNGTLDYELRQSENYRKNFMKSLENASHFENYNLLVNKLNTLRNPIKFYEFVNKSEIFADIFIWYDSLKGQAVIGNFTTDEAMFNYGLEELGLI